MRYIIKLLGIFCLLLSLGCNQEQSYRLGVDAEERTTIDLANLAALMSSEPASQQDILRFVPTKSSQASLRLLEKKLIDFTIVPQDVFASYLMHHSEDEILYAAVAVLASPSCHIIVHRDSKIQDIYDLIHKKIALGDIESGTFQIAENIFSANGLKKELVTPVYGSFSKAKALFLSKAVDALIIVDHIPSALVQDLFAHHDLTLLSLDKNALETLLAYNYGYATSLIPAHTYSGLNHSVLSIKANELLLAQQNVEDEVAQEILRKLAIQKQAQLTAKPRTVKNDNSFKTALANLSANNTSLLQFHPGAAILYKQNDISVQVYERKLSVNKVIKGQD